MKYVFIIFLQGHLIPGAYKFDALITTFEMVLSDCPELREISWRCVIIDEAHRLKNRNCKLLDSLKMLDLVSGPFTVPHCWDMSVSFYSTSNGSPQEHKVLLTGTPLQNTVEELFSLLHFLEPAQFPSEIEFLREFGDLKTEEQVWNAELFFHFIVTWYETDNLVISSFFNRFRNSSLF